MFGLRMAMNGMLALALLLAISPAFAQNDAPAGEPASETPSENPSENPSETSDQKGTSPALAEPDPAIDGDGDLGPIIVDEMQPDDDFGVAWPDFQAPVLSDEDRIQATAPDDRPDARNSVPSSDPDQRGDAVDDGIIDQAKAQAEAEAEAQADADAYEDSSLIAGDIAESIAQDIRNATETGEALDNISRSFGSFRLVLDYVDDTLPPADREALAKRFDALSTLELIDAGDSNIAQLKRGADRDRDVLEQLLRVYGHYDGFVTQSVEAAREGLNEVVIIFTIQAGPQYNLGDIDLGRLAQTGEDYPFFQNRFNLGAGDPINGDAIIAARDNLAASLSENGYAFATLEEPELLIDHAQTDGDLTLPVDPGRKYVFGDIVVGDDPLLDADHLALIARFARGDIFRQSRIQDLRRAILATGLASSVAIEAVATDKPPQQGADSRLGPTSEAADAEVDLAVDIVPAPMRTVAGEIGFGTGEGFRVAASWEHRNLFPPEGLGRIRGIIGTQEQLLGATFRRNNFRERDQILIANALIANVQRDAFDARTLLFSAALQRQTNLIFQKRWTWSIGAELVLTDETDIVGAVDTTGRRTFAIAAIPATLAYDGSDDLLDPTSGFRLSAFISPELSFQSGTFTYARTQIDGSFYQQVRDNVVLAGRLRLGSNFGAETLDVAPSRRLYSGGGGSVRGFGFQDIGPLDVNGDPIGGRSLAEFALEARIRFGDFGIVPFLDAGNIYDETLPTLGGLRYGAGIGLRYYSSFGPLRLDVGTPINPRPGDAIIGVYVSLGQAF